MKVKCIMSSDKLTLDKEYEVLEFRGEYYVTENDDGIQGVYFKSRFKEGVDNSMKIRCINNKGYEGYLTEGMEYVLISKAIDENFNKVIRVYDNYGDDNVFPGYVFSRGEDKTQEISKIEVEEEPKEGNMVNHPSHYNIGKYEVIDVIDDWELGFSLGNAVKYIARAGHKWNTVEDLEKAIFYIQHEIDRIKKEEQ